MPGLVRSFIVRGFVEPQLPIPRITLCESGRAPSGAASRVAPLRRRPRVPHCGARPQTRGARQNGRGVRVRGRGHAARSGSVPGGYGPGSGGAAGGLRARGLRPAAPPAAPPGGQTPLLAFPARAGSGDCPSGLLKACHVRDLQVLGKRPHTGLTASPVGQYVFNMRAYLMFIDRATIGIILLYVPVTRFNIIILHAILVFISRH